MNTYTVCIKDGARIVVDPFEAMGPDRVTVQRQHEGLCPPGAQCCVYPARQEMRASALRAASQQSAREIVKGGA